jgi:hypothetical protein
MDGFREGSTHPTRFSRTVRNPYSRSWLWIPARAFARPGTTERGWRARKRKEKSDTCNQTVMSDGLIANERSLSGGHGSAAMLCNVIDVIDDPLFLCSPVLENAQAKIESIFYRASSIPHLGHEF